MIDINQEICVVKKDFGRNTICQSLFFWYSENGVKVDMTKQKKTMKKRYIFLAVSVVLVIVCTAVYVLIVGQTYGNL